MLAKYLYVLYLVIICFCLALLYRSDYDDELFQQAEYCDMNKLYISTNGQLGWPNYKGITCK